MKFELGVSGRFSRGCNGFRGSCGLVCILSGRVSGKVCGGEKVCVAVREGVFPMVDGKAMVQGWEEVAGTFGGVGVDKRACRGIAGDCWEMKRIDRGER